jgi:hypothetical protein
LSSLHETPGSKLPEIGEQCNILEGTLRGWYDEERRTKAGTAPLNDLKEINEQILDPPPKEDNSIPKKTRRQRYSNGTTIQVSLALETRHAVWHDSGACSTVLSWATGRLACVLIESFPVFNTELIVRV